MSRRIEKQDAMLHSRSGKATIFVQKPRQMIFEISPLYQYDSLRGFHPKTIETHAELWSTSEEKWHHASMIDRRRSARICCLKISLIH